MTAFSKISKLVMISMGRAGYTDCSVGGGIKLYLGEKGQSGYKTVFKNMARVFYTHCFTAVTQETTLKTNNKK